MECPTLNEIKEKIASEEIEYDFFSEICPEYNRDLLDSIKFTVRVMIVTGIILALILDLACYKYRRLTYFILYFEGAHSLFYTMIPNTYWSELPIVWIGINYFVMFLCQL